MVYNGTTTNIEKINALAIESVYNETNIKCLSTIRCVIENRVFDLYPNTNTFREAMIYWAKIIDSRN